MADSLQVCVKLSDGETSVTIPANPDMPISEFLSLVKSSSELFSDDIDPETARFWVLFHASNEVGRRTVFGFISSEDEDEGEGEDSIEDYGCQFPTAVGDEPALPAQALLTIDRGNGPDAEDEDIRYVEIFLKSLSGPSSGKPVSLADVDRLAPVIVLKELIMESIENPEEELGIYGDMTCFTLAAVPEFCGCSEEMKGRMNEEVFVWQYGCANEAKIPVMIRTRDDE